MGRGAGAAVSAQYRIQVAAQMSGVSAVLIRAWERRYGILKPKRTSSGYRTYSDADIVVLKRLKELTAEGVSIAQAATMLPGIRRELTSRKPLKAPAEPQLQRWQQDVLQAAQRLDQSAVERVLDEALRSMAPVAFYEELLSPLMREVGDRWHGGTFTVAQEHLVSAVVREKLVALLARAPRRSKRHVLCACPPDETHELGLLGAALRFRHAGWRVTLLGPRTPVEQLAAAARELEPELVALSLVDTTGAREFLNELAKALPEGQQVVLGGQGAQSAAEHARKHGFRVVESDADWKRVLRRTR